MKRDNVGITNAQKHDLLIKFNQEREELENTYQQDKLQRKTLKAEEAKADEPASDKTYSKLYRQLGPH